MFVEAPWRNLKRDYLRIFQLSVALILLILITFHTLINGNVHVPQQIEYGFCFVCILKPGRSSVAQSAPLRYE
jgi:hypothetical protein